MTISDWTALASALAWPIVALLALAYIWQSDAIGKLLQISKAIDELKERLNDLVEVEERLNRSTSGLTAVTSSIDSFQKNLASIEFDIQTIKDTFDAAQIDASPDQNVSPAIGSHEDATKTYEQIETAWNDLIAAMRAKFGEIDARMVGGYAYSFAHGNRKGPKLTYDDAEKIGRLHSEIKGYRRRRSTLNDWLSPELAETFIQNTDEMRRVVDGA